MGEALLIRETNSNSSDTSTYMDAMCIGDTFKTARTISDSRFIKCYGQTIYSTTYPELYMAIKDKFYQDSSNTSLYKYDVENYSYTTHAKYMKVSN